MKILVIEDNAERKSGGGCLFSEDRVDDNNSNGIVYYVYFLQAKDLKMAIPIDTLPLLKHDVIIIDILISSDDDIEWIEEAAKKAPIVLLESTISNIILNKEKMSKLRKNKKILITGKSIFEICIIVNNYETINFNRFK